MALINKLFIKRFCQKLKLLRCYSSTRVCVKELKFYNETSAQPIPTYSILTPEYDEPYKDSLLSDRDLVNMYKAMVRINIMDNILYECQRQGRISFYMTNFGEEGVQIGSAAALSIDDLIYAQYREAGVLLWRGFEYEEFINQCFGNQFDGNKGRQMPVHYGCKRLNFVTISSPLTTQLPQAAGAAYGYKLTKKDQCVACYFGEGAASEGDFHAAFNFAATLACPVIFICRNNQYAISTPHYQQYASDGIAIKGLAYGMNSIRVDGNDILAVHDATKFARQYAVKENRPVLIEAMTYRIGHHSTSDDSSVYRKKSEIDSWQSVSPIARFRQYLEKRNLWNRTEEENLVKENRKQVLKYIDKAEKCEAPPLDDLFTDVYKNMPDHISKQMESMKNHVQKYSKNYPLSKFKQESKI